MRSINFILLFIILIECSACTGQSGVDQNVGSTSIDHEVTQVSKLPNKIWKIFQDKKNNYWFGSNGEGVYYYNETSLVQYSEKDGLLDGQIRDIQEDQAGSIFVETHQGVHKFDGVGFTPITPIESTSNQWQIKPNDLWFNCGGYVNRYDGNQLFKLKLPEEDLEEAFDVEEVRGLGFKDMNHSPYAVFAIDKDKEGNMWFGTAVAGAYRYDGNSFLWFGEKELSTLPDGRVPGVRSMLQDKNGYYWLSNFISKYRIIEADGEPQYEKHAGFDLSIPAIQNRFGYFNSGLVDRQGNLWMTTYGGIVWKYDGESLHDFPVADTDALIISIYEDNNGTLWLGTDNLGVFKFNGLTFDRFHPVQDK